MESDKIGFLKRLKNIQEIPSLPLIVTKVNQMLDDRNTTMDELTRVIEKDQAIVFKMLLLVNSAFFGLREKVSSVKEAAIILGFDAIRNIIISLATFDTLTAVCREEKNAWFNADDFWRHSIAVAVLSKYLSEKMQMGDPSKAFVNGLLHDIGKLVLAFYFKTEFKAALEKARKEKLIYMAAERKILPAGHSDVGYFVAKKWDLPDLITNSIYHHHKLRTGCPSWDETIVVNTADGFTNSFIHDTLNSTTTSGILIPEYFDPNSKKRMKPVIESSAKWFPGVLDSIHGAQAFFFK